MAETTPTLPDAHIVRTYSECYATTDTESEGEARFEASSGDADRQDISVILEEDRQDISVRLEQNQQFMDRQINPTSGESSSWILEPQSWKTTESSEVILSTEVILIRKPTASNLSHRLLNPFIYRSIQNVGALENLASLLCTPEDWADRYNQVVYDGRILAKLASFRDLPNDAAESDIQARFIGIVEAIAYRLGIHVNASSKTKIIVGGIMARSQYDLRSKTDPHFMNSAGRNLIASEVKTHRTFGFREMWYHGSRGIQVLSAMYAFNCPTFLFTQKQWKLFIENQDRNAVLTFPYNDNQQHSPHVNSSLVHQMGSTFLKAIVICLLSQRVSTAAVSPRSSIVNETPQKKVIKEKRFDTPSRPKTKSARLQEENDLEQDNTFPSFVSGYREGQPIYTTIRVVPPEGVARIEDEIAFQETKHYQKQSSETTLYE